MQILSFYFKTPFSLEKAILTDTLKILKQFLITYKNILKDIFQIIRFKKSNSFLKSITILIIFYFLNNLYPDRIYHYLKEQSLMRVYVLFGVLELAEKLIGTLCDDIIENIDIDGNNLKGNSIDCNLKGNNIDINKKGNNLKGNNIESSIDINKQGNNINIQNIDNIQNIENIENNLKGNYFLNSLLFVCSTLCHTLIFYFQYLIIQLSLNTSLTNLYSLIISIQFIELKGNVFKKGNKNNLFSIIDNDSLKRFNLTIYLIIAFLSLFSESEESYKILFFLEPILIIFFLKIFIDWIKHIFFCRFNNLDLNIYDEYRMRERRNNFIGQNILVMWLVYDFIGCGVFKYLILFLSITCIILKLFF